jgi:predicted metal-binding membrane protein
MSETPEPTTESTPVSHEPADATKPARLRRALTWVGIVAGAVIVVAAIFVAGAATSWFSGRDDQPRHEASCMMGMKDMPSSPMPGDKGQMPDGKDCCGPKKS